MDRRALVVAVAASLPWAARAAEPPAAPAPPPEVKKTVEAIAGRWTLAASMLMPGAKQPLKFAEKLDCKKVAAGRGVSCSDVAKVPGMGTTDFTHLIAYDAERKAVHWFAVGSTGEVHDHVCHWKDDKTLTCDPLKATMEGAPVTETVTVVFDGGKMTWEATTTTKDGDVKYTATAKKTP